MRRFSSPGDFARHLLIARQRLGDAEHAALDHAGAVVAKEAKDLIGTEYAGWPALADSTIARKQALGQTGRVSETDPLLATGELRASVKHYVDGNRVVIGTPDPVGVFHEFGTSRMPPRSFLRSALFRKAPEVAKTMGDTVVATVAGRSVTPGSTE